MDRYIHVTEAGVFQEPSKGEGGRICALNWHRGDKKRHWQDKRRKKQTTTLNSNQGKLHLKIQTHGIWCGSANSAICIPYEIA